MLSEAIYYAYHIRAFSKTRTLNFLTHPGTNSFWKLINIIIIIIIIIIIVVAVVVVIIITIIIIYNSILCPTKQKKKEKHCTTHDVEIICLTMKI